MLFTSRYHNLSAIWITNMPFNHSDPWPCHKSSFCSLPNFLWNLKLELSQLSSVMMKGHWYKMLFTIVTPINTFLTVLDQLINLNYQRYVTSFAILQHLPWQCFWGCCRSQICPNSPSSPLHQTIRLWQICLLSPLLSLTRYDIVLSQWVKSLIQKQGCNSRVHQPW